MTLYQVLSLGIQGLIAAGAFIYAHLTRKLVQKSDKQRWTDHFLEYTRRYDEIWGKMPRCVTERLFLRRGSEVTSGFQMDWFSGDREYALSYSYERGPGIWGGASGAPPVGGSQAWAYGKGFFLVTHGELLQLLARYFNLCSEEHYLWKKGELDPDAWKIWMEGMRWCMGLETLKSAWEARREEYERYYGDFSDWFEREIVRKAIDHTQELPQGR